MSHTVHRLNKFSASDSEESNNPTSGDKPNPPKDVPQAPGSGNERKNEEPTFSILPHPAKTNDPADLQPGGGLRSSGGVGEIFNTPGPFVPKDDMKNNLPAPLSREELQARQAELRSEVPAHDTQ